MTLPDTFSRRQRAAKSIADIYKYDEIPERLKVQAVQIIAEGIGPYYYNGDHAPGAAYYDLIVKHLRREQGVHELALWTKHQGEEFFQWMEAEKDVHSWLDGLEAALRTIDVVVRREGARFARVTGAKPDQAIEEMNARMREAGFGYQYVSGTIISLDSQHLHRDVVVPALTLLREERFKAAEQEYLSAHEAYKDGQFEDALVDCGKALESVLKVLGLERGWEFKDTDPASKLIQSAVKSGFLAAHHDASLNHLAGLIESSTPTLRNKSGGHGAGNKPRVVPRHLAAYQLHQTAAVMLFLVEQDAAL